MTRLLKILLFTFAAATTAERGWTATPQLSEFGNVPLYFEANPDQTSVDHTFMARGSRCSFFVAPTEAALTLVRSESHADGIRGKRGGIVAGRVTETRTLHFKFLGANPSARAVGSGELPGKVNYLLGNDPAQWRSGVAMFAQVRVEEIFPGVTLVYYGNQQRLEYDFVVAPQADPRPIAIQFAGADQIRVDEQGDLVFKLGREEIRQPKPCLYQVGAGVRKEISGGYRLKNPRTVVFEVGDYDHSLPLVIDPVLSFSTFFGRAGMDIGWDIAVGADGAIYVAGETMSTGLATPGAFQTAYKGGTGAGGDAFVAKFSSVGSNAPLYVTYLGGSGDDAALALAVDNAGNAYVTGFTSSRNFPATGLFTSIGGQPFPGSSYYYTDGFVTKLGASGSNLVFSTYLGGGATDVGIGIAVDANDYVYVAGYTESSTNFPIASALQLVYGGNGDAFVSKLGPAGTNLIYSTYLGGTNQDVGNSIVVGAAGDAFVAGATSSTNFPVKLASQSTSAGGLDAFVTWLPANGTPLVKSTYLGGYDNDIGYRIVRTDAGVVYLTGSSASFNFPRTPSGIAPGGVFKTSNAGGSWEPSSQGLEHTWIASLAIDPSTPTTLYAGTGRGIARSDNSGMTWDTKISFPPETNNYTPAIAVGTIAALAVDPTKPATLYAGTIEGVFKSIDRGTNWTLNSTGMLNAASLNVQALGIDPLTTATLYAGTQNGVFRSTNGAASWTNVNNGLGNLNVRAVVLDPHSPATLYVATLGGVFRSTNGGDHWSAMNNGLSNLFTTSLAMDPVTPSVLYAGTSTKPFKSSDGGTNWTAIDSQVVTNGVNAIAIDPINPAVVYLASSFGVFRSADAGASWVKITNGLTVSGSAALAIDPQAPATAYAGTMGNSSGGGEDVFITAFETNFFSIVFGGSFADEGWDLALDTNGYLYVCGSTTSFDFPITNALSSQATNAGGSDAFVSALAADGSHWLYSTYLGGSNNDYGYNLDLDATGALHLVGQTASTNFPTVFPFQPTYGGGSADVFFAKIVANLRLLCSADKVVECGAAWTFDEPATAFGCGSNTITILNTVTNATCGNGYEATRTWRATDACGNDAHCSQTVVVLNSAAPAIQCASNKVVLAGDAWTFDDPVANDGCITNPITIVSTTTNYPSAGTYSVTRTWEVTNTCGGSATCSQTVTETDSPAPTLSVALSGSSFIMSWPDYWSAFQLQSSTNLMITTAWVDVTNAPVFGNGQFTVTVDTIQQLMFFRLRKP